MTDFARSLPVILKAEGGYVHDPDDRGGATNKGVTQKTYDSWRKSELLPVRPVKEIQDVEVETIYRQDYWFAGRCDALAWPVSLVHFDACVNHGVGRASKMLQDAAGVAVDGKVGPKTIAAVNADPAGVVKRYLEERERFYRLIGIGNQGKFLKGWLARLGHLSTAAT